MPSLLRKLAPGTFSYADGHSYVSRLRKRRMALLREPMEQLQAELDRPARILDVGGGYMFWRQCGFLDPERFHITLLNLAPPPLPPEARGFTSQEGDACRLTAEPGDYDLVFSNSVIEHVGSRDRQVLMAKEIQRVCNRYIVQTPNYWFPFEPHAQLPLFQFLPHAVRALVIRCVHVGDWFPRQTTYAGALAVSRSIRLLTHGDLRALFPGARILRERFLGLTKSLVAIHGLSPHHAGE